VVEEGVGPQELVRQSRAAHQGRALLRAVHLAREAVVQSRAAQLPEVELEAMWVLGTALWSHGDIEQAAQVLGAADRRGRELGRAVPEDLQPLIELAQTSPGWTAPDVPLQTGVAAPRLSSSELTVARLVASGLTNQEVAEQLFVSPNTVKAHLRRAFAKLGVHRRTELAKALET
jgi:DNA-binding NarL/FixJ family response regulator